MMDAEYTMKRNIYAFLPARDEEENLPACLESLLNQNVKPSKIVVVNDASIDHTAEIATSYGVDIINLTWRHESYSSPEKGWLVATIWNHAFPAPTGTEYILQMGADAILPQNYVERLIELMEDDPKLVIASGSIRNEPSVRSHPRGVGRLYKAWFWNEYIQKFPLGYCAESYPLFKALSLGLHIRSFQDLMMETKRPTILYKAKYGYAMRELGYFPPYALAKCFLSFLLSPKDGIMMFKTYLTSPFKPKYRAITRFIRRYQINKLWHLKETFKVWIARMETIEV